MGFKMRREVFDWFRHVDGKKPLKTKFDIYYMCFLLGVSAGRFSTAANSKEFIDYFVPEYQSSQRTIIGLLLYAELNHLGVDLSENTEVKIQIERLVDSSDSMLTDDGFEKMNAYANEGFNIIFNKVVDKPRDSIEFLQLYSHVIEGQIKDSSLWNSY
jgi:hypothetical protein